MDHGWGKITDPAWIGSEAGAAVTGFAQGAIQQTTGEHPQVTGWYAGFLESIVIPNAALFSYLVVFGAIAVGLALILGLFTGIASFFGGFMNASFIFAGTAGANPLCSSCRPGSCWPVGSQGIGALTVGFCLP